MAIFNPDPPAVSAPDWTNVIKPIQQPMADKSTGLTLAALGEGLDEGAKLADTTEKSYLKDKVETSVNTIRDAYTAGLIGVRNAQISGTIPTPSDTLATPDTQPIPGGLQAGLQRATSIGTAMAQNGGGGKANDTLYTGALAATAKQLRNQYPGYKDYIDEQIKSVSGVDPANAFMKNLLTDINQSGTAAKSETDKAISYARENIGVDPHMPAYIEAIRQNIPGAIQNMESVVAKGQYLDAQHKRFMADHQEIDQGNADDKVAAQDQYRVQLTGKMSQLFNGVVDIPGITAPSTLAKLISDQQTGKVTLTDEQNTQLLGLARQAQQQFNLAAVNLQNGDGKYARRIGDQDAVDKITKGVGQLFQQNVDAIGDKNYGTMGTNQRRVNAITGGDAPMQVLSSNDLGLYARQSSAWKLFGGDAWVNTVNGQMLADGGYGKFTHFIEDQKRIAQIPDDLRKDGQVKSMYDSIQKAKQWAAENNEPVPSKVFNNLVDNVNTIVNPKAPDAEKLEVANYAFKPKNWGIMNQFGADFTETKADGSTVQHKGRNSVFDTMTAQGMTDNMWKLSRQPGGAQAWDNYKNFGEQSFKTIFGEEVKTLNGIISDQSMPYKISWDSDNRRFGINYPAPKTDVEANYIKNSTAVINRLNSGLGNLARIQDHEGTDTSAYLIKTLTDVGFRPGTEVGGLPQKIYDAIKASHRSNRIEDAFKAAQ